MEKDVGRALWSPLMSLVKSPLLCWHLPQHLAMQRSEPELPHQASSACSGQGSRDLLQPSQGGVWSAVKTTQLHSDSSGQTPHLGQTSVRHQGLLWEGDRQVGTRGPMCSELQGRVEPSREGDYVHTLSPQGPFQGFWGKRPEY